MDSSKQFLCDECGVLFAKNKSLLRHVREKHQGMKRTDNETRKRDVTDKVRKQGHLACTDIRTCEVPVESIPQAVFKRPAEYVATVIITFTVLHSQFWIHSDYSLHYIHSLDYSLHYIHSFGFTVIITLFDYSDYYIV